MSPTPFSKIVQYELIKLHTFLKEPDLYLRFSIRFITSMLQLEI